MIRKIFKLKKNNTKHDKAQIGVTMSIEMLFNWKNKTKLISEIEIRTILFSEFPDPFLQTKGSRFTETKTRLLMDSKLFFQQ